jgi:hypothetical protein
MAGPLSIPTRTPPAAQPNPLRSRVRYPLLPLTCGSRTRPSTRAPPRRERAREQESQRGRIQPTRGLGPNKSVRPRVPVPLSRNLALAALPTEPPRSVPSSSASSSRGRSGAGVHGHRVSHPPPLPAGAAIGPRLQLQISSIIRIGSAIGSGSLLLLPCRSRGLQQGSSACWSTGAAAWGSSQQKRQRCEVIPSLPRSRPHLLGCAIIDCHGRGAARPGWCGAS